MTSWHELVKELDASLRSHKEKGDIADLKPYYASPEGSERLLGALSGWVESSVAESNEMYAESLSRRVCWLFANNMVFCWGEYSFSPALINITEKINEDDKPSFLDSDWYYNERANSWDYDNDMDSSSVIALVQTLTEAYGEPALLLPWERRIESTIDEGEDAYSYFEEYEEEYKDAEAMLKICGLVNDGLVAEVSPWNLQICYDEDYISEYSELGKYVDLISELENKKLAVLVLEEHCASCSRGMYESIVESDPELSGKPLFISWSQNSQYLVNPNGETNIDLYFTEEEQPFIDLLEKMAKERQLAFSASTGQYGGIEVVFGSGYWL